MTDLSFLKHNRHLLIRLGASLLLFMGLAVIFGWLATDVHEGETLAFDQSFLREINSHSNSFLNSFFLVVTEAGGPVVMSVLTIALFAYSVYKKYRYNALLIAAGFGGATILNYIVKITVERARPELWTRLINETTYSFPSGHAASSSALAICIVAILWRTKWRIPALIIAPIIVGLIGFSRMYLGVHYLTDVVAGWMLSIAWLTLVIVVLYTRRSQKRASAEQSAANSPAENPA